MAKASQLQLEIERAAWEYGKIGLLIDDSPQGGTRVARALYGGEVLPPWWKIACSIRCGCEALRTFRGICADRRFGFLRALAVIDRYLPAECGEGKAIPWSKPDYTLDERDRIHVEEMQQVVSGLLKGSADLKDQFGQEPAYALRFVTSFPALSEGLGSGGGSEEDGDLSIPWQTRSIELLQEERGFMAQRNSDWQSLLRFGPERTARIIKDFDTCPSLRESARAREAARWKAVTWHQNLEKVAALLQGDGPVILVTGAGASLAPSRWSSGMPATEEMLEEACAKLLKIKINPLRSLPKRQDTCDCQAPASQPEKRVPWDGRSGTPIDWLVNGFTSEQGVRGLDWRLEEVFARKLHEPQGTFDFNEFHRVFRDTLYRSDYSYTYYHWLLARLPWTSLITTNFDGFHERAAAAVATLPSLDQKQRCAALRLGTLRRTESFAKDADRQVELDSNHSSYVEEALFKPYGSLYSLDGVIALGFEEIEAFEAHLRRALKGALVQAKTYSKKRGALVVIGHAMRDKSIDQVLKGLKKELDDFDLLWVDPASYERSWEGRAGNRFVWSQWIYERMEGHIPHSGAVPATALEFIYDLWWKYNNLPGS